MTFHHLRNPFFGVALFAMLVSTLMSDSSRAQDFEYRQLMSEAVRSAANEVLPSIVMVEVIGGTGGANGDVEQDAPTSGVVVDSDGYVIVSDIVVRRPSASLLVMLPDQTRHAAKVVAQDFHRHLVLLKMEAKSKLTAIDFPESASLEIGQTTVAVGRYGSDAAPLVSRGILSGQDRLDGVALQFDARISPSFYGGLLVDLHGNPLGISIPAVAAGGAEEATSWYDSGIAFAVPLSVIKKNLPRMKEGENIKKGLMGFVPNSKDPYENDTKVAAVRVRSPAESSGLKAGDVIKSIEGVKVQRQQEIRQVLGRFDAGDEIQMEIMRDGGSQTLQITLTDSIPPLTPQRLGVMAANISVDNPEDPEQERTKVVVEHIVPESPSDGKLEVGDVVLKLGEVPIANIDFLRRQLIASEEGKEIVLTIDRSGESRTVSVIPETIDASSIQKLPPDHSATSGKWKIEALKLPDSANEAAVLIPGDDEKRGPLGLLILLLNPGEDVSTKVLESWQKAAQELGVVVCAVMPESNERWQPKEIEVMAKFAASIQKSQSIDPQSVAIASPAAVAGGKAAAADSMAVAVALSSNHTFYGVAVAAKTRPPAVRLRENDAEASLQILLPIASKDELPTWAPTLQKTGFPVVRGGEVTQEDLLTWVRGLQAI
ncbi:Periplasmic serine endoprotease DegP precursor [Novipirellula aureliae]|uniref:Periplasmic serine endoprotease DegP n=2 Tax=Novipirellula aureliae TaxID=2527966 RepID=A0A5C6DF58_9BACT|nr:Periplasmic serine endoprotease DegP precursor [Novipirellula aureliae]